MYLLKDHHYTNRLTEDSGKYIRSVLRVIFFDFLREDLCFTYSFIIWKTGFSLSRNSEMKYTLSSEDAELAFFTVDLEFTNVYFITHSMGNPQFEA